MLKLKYHTKCRNKPYYAKYDKYANYDIHIMKKMLNYIMMFAMMTNNKQIYIKFFKFKPIIYTNKITKNQKLKINNKKI